MPQLVSVDGVGTVEFPDDATESEIILTLNREYPSPERKSLMDEMASARSDRAFTGAVESGITAAEQLAQGASLGGWMQNIGNVQEAISPGTQQTKENATRMAGQFIGETIKTPLDFLIPEAQEETRREYSSGIGQAAAGLVTGLPEALPLIAAGAAAGPAYATTVTSKFATDMALGGYELLKAAKQAEAEGDTAAAKNLNAQALASLGMAGTIVAPPVFRGVVSRINPRAIPRPEKQTVSAEDISTIAEPTPLTPVSIPELAVQTAGESVTKAGETVGAVDVTSAFKTAKDNAAAQIASARAAIEAARNRQLGTTTGEAGKQVIAAGGLPEAASKAMAGSVSATLEAGKQAPGIASQAAIDRAGLALGKAEKSLTESTASVEGLNRIVSDVGDLIASIDNLQKMGIVPTPVSQNPLEEAAELNATKAAANAEAQGLKLSAAQVAEPPLAAQVEVPVQRTARLGGTPTEQPVVSEASPSGTPAPIKLPTSEGQKSQQPEVSNAIPIRETAPLPVAEAPKAGAEVGAPVRQQAAQVQPEAKVAQQAPHEMSLREFTEKYKGVDEELVPAYSKSELSKQLSAQNTQTKQWIEQKLTQQDWFKLDEAARKSAAIEALRTLPNIPKEQSSLIADVAELLPMRFWQGEISVLVGGEHPSAGKYKTMPRGAFGSMVRNADGTLRPFDALTDFYKPTIDVIALFNARNPTDFFHEAGHRWSKKLLSADDQGAARSIYEKSPQYEKWKKAVDTGNEYSAYRYSYEEWFANRFHDYLLKRARKEVEGFPSKLRSVFDNFRELLASIWKRVRGSWSSDLSQLLDRSFGIEQPSKPAPIGAATGLDWFTQASDEFLAQRHRMHVESAIRSGKQVPDYVLKDYPDLRSPAPTVTPALETLPSAAQGTETPKPTLAQQPGTTAEGTPPVGPGIVGMGAAVPADYNVRTGATAMKYMEINRERKERGQEEIPKPESVSDQQAVDRAMAEIDKFYYFPDDLAAKIINNPRTIDDWESHALLIRRVDYRNEMFRAAEEMKLAVEDGRLEDARRAQGRYSEYGQKLDNIEIASRLSGSERGRALRALRVLMNEDYSLEKLRNDLRVAKGVERTERGKWISEEEEAQIQKIADDYARLQEEIKKREDTVEVEQSQKALDETVKTIKGEIQKDHNNGKKSPTPDVADSTRVKLIAKVKSKIAHGKSEEIHPQIYKLERLLIESGIRERDALVDAIHSFFPELTRREVSDAMSGYGNFKPLSQDAISIIQRDIHGQLQQISKLEDLQAKVPLKKSGIERRVESAEERRLKKQVEEYKRRYGVVVTDPATQLKSAMDARKTRLRHEIEDLEYQIQAKEKIVKDKTKLGTDEETQSLIARRDELKREFDIAFPKQELTYEQQVALAVASLDREIAKVQDQIKTGKIFPEAKQQLTSPEIEARRSQLDALREERQNLRKLDEGYKERNIQAELDRIEKRASELQDQINAGDVLAKKTATKVVDPRIEAARAEVKELNKVKVTLRNQLKEKKPWEQIALQTLKTRLTRELADYKERIANGDFVKREPRKFPLDPTTTALKFEVQKIKHDWNVKKQEEAYKNLSRLDKAKAFTASSMDATRKLMTSFDLSAVLRQGGFLGFAHPVRSAKILLDRKFWNAVNTEKGIHAENERIMNRDNAPNYVRDKLFLADQNGKLSGQEEVYMNKSWVDRIPGIGKSERAYVAFLNRLRVDSYDAMAAGLKKGAELTPEEGRAIANYINIATGRGTLFENAMVGMSRVFFAPRYVTSQLQMMYGSPMWLYKKGEWTPGRVRKMIAKDYMRQLTGLMVFYGLGMLAGGQLETDWRSSDFMSLLYGNTRVNPVKGMSQLGILGARTWTGEKLNARGMTVPIRGEGVKYGGGKLDSEYWKFLRKKAAPYPGAALDILSGEDVLGREVTPLEVGKKLFTPMSIPQLVELLRENGVPAAVALGALNQLGVSVQTYDERLFNPR